MGSKNLGGDEDAEIVDINITPFVDIILVVLIIFMVTATYIVKKSIKVTLPDAATGEATEDSSIGVTLDTNRQIFLGDDPTPKTEDDLRALIRSEKARLAGTGNEVICLIAADHAVSHGEVVRLIDVVKQEGVARFAINIDPVKPEEAVPARTTP